MLGKRRTQTDAAVRIEGSCAGELGFVNPMAEPACCSCSWLWNKCRLQQWLGRME